MGDGYVKLWRKSMDSQVWADPDLWRTWTCCLMLANHKPAWVKVSGLAAPVKVEPGQFITGRFEFHQAMYPKKKKSNPAAFTVWRWLNTLKMMQNVCIKSCNKFSVITVVNWEAYQNGVGIVVQQNVPETSSTCAARVQHVCTNKNEKNEENVKQKTISSSAKPMAADSDFETFWKSYPRKVGKAACLKKWKQMNGSKPPMDKLLASLEAQKKTPQWTRDGGQYIPHPMTWLGQGRWDDEPVDPLVPKITRRPLNFRDAM